MKFVYFTIDDGSYLVMNNLHTEGEFVKNEYLVPTLFNEDTKIGDIYHLINIDPSKKIHKNKIKI